METIPPMFWMVVVGLITVMICFVLFYLAMVLKETKRAIEGSKDLIKKTTLIVDDTQEMIATVKGTVREVNEGIIVPIRNIAHGVDIASSFIRGLKKDKEEE